MKTGARRGRMAVAIVVLPPAAVSRRAVAANRRLDDRSIVLGPQARPHLTLAMAAVERKDVPAIAAALRALARESHAFPVRLTRVVRLRRVDHTTAWYEAAPSASLSAWHRRAVALLAPYRRRTVTARDFLRAPGQRVSASAIRWVRRFDEDAAFARYRPHITLGYGELEDDPALPLSFDARRLALCHLGNHCTCAGVLAEGRLGARRRRLA